jgi:hypothetical protein
VSTDRFDDAILATCTAERCRVFARYWLSLPRLDGLPPRSAFDPLAIPKLLPHIVLHDLRQPGRSIMRLVGTRMVDRFGFDPTGRDYTDFVAPERRGAALSALTAMAWHPCGMRVLLRGEYAGGHAMEAESIGFPLSDDSGDGRFLVFVDDLTGRPRVWDRRAHPLRTLHVRERIFLDIGAGVPGEA